MEQIMVEETISEAEMMVVETKMILVGVVKGEEGKL
jgi:hypothetical protein